MTQKLDSIFDFYIHNLSKFITFKSVSTFEDVTEIGKTVDWLERLFTNSGFSTKVIRGYDNPVIIAEYIVNPDFPTVLVYGHYDVQPASTEEWGTDPFKLEMKDGKIFGRGVSDNKGQFFVHFSAISKLIEENALIFNVKFIIEGNEETGSPNIKPLLEKFRDELKSVMILISDSSMIQDNPTMEVGLRGTFNTTLNIYSSDKDLHSGLFGGVAVNSAHVASQFLSELFDDFGNVTYKEFYNDVEISQEDIKLTDSIPFNKRNILTLTGNSELMLDSKENYYQKVGLKPTIQVTGLSSGYNGVGYRNSVPHQTSIKLNFRLVSNQTPDKVLKDFKQYCEKKLPDFVRHSFAQPEKTEGAVNPVRIDSTGRYHKHIKLLLESVYGAKVYYDFNGATLPIINSFNEVFGNELLMVALANEDCNMHAVGENFDLQKIKKALEFSYKFFSTKL